MIENFLSYRMLKKMFSSLDFCCDMDNLLRTGFFANYQEEFFQRVLLKIVD